MTRVTISDNSDNIKERSFKVVTPMQTTNEDILKLIVKDYKLKIFFVFEINPKIFYLDLHRKVRFSSTEDSLLTASTVAPPTYFQL
jgi:hypothetical protein